MPLCFDDLELAEEFPVFLYTHRYTHRGNWIRGHARQWGTDPILAIGMEEHIEAGTSGSPVITADGALVGIVSWAGGPSADKTREMSAPLPHLTLPVWIVRQIKAAQTGKA